MIELVEDLRVINVFGKFEVIREKLWTLEC